MGGKAEEAGFWWRVAVSSPAVMGSVLGDLCQSLRGADLGVGSHAVGWGMRMFAQRGTGWMPLATAGQGCGATAMHRAPSELVPMVTVGIHLPNPNLPLWSESQ